MYAIWILYLVTNDCKIRLPVLSAYRRVRRLAKLQLTQAVAAYLEVSWRSNRRRAIPHTLPQSLTVTLTSYPPRFPTLALTIKSILAQSMKADRVDLWIAEDDFALLPSSVRHLEEAGLRINLCEDLRSYKKIIPELRAGDATFLVTADDDQYYSRHWLLNLITSYRAGRKEVVCTRAHRIRLNSAGLPRSYMEWELDVAEGTSGDLIFPTGLGGVLYEPGIFHSDILRAEIFQSVCPTADDVWLYWMAGLNGARFRKVGARMRQLLWANSQDVSLFALNRNANDEQIAGMISRYGFPPQKSPDATSAI